MKADYKNWMPKGMVLGFLGATGVLLLITLITMFLGLPSIVQIVFLILTVLSGSQMEVSVLILDVEVEL